VLNSIIRFSLNHRLFLLSATIALILGGLASLQSMPVDVFPDLNRPTVTIMTESHGMAPEEVETLVTIPLESFLNGLPGVERVRSVSGIGLSVLYVEFGWGTDIYRNRQLVAEKLSLAQERMPEGVTPVMGPISSIMGQIQMLALGQGDSTLDPIELRTIAEWVIRPRLLTIPGVAQVISIGGGLKQYQIHVSAEKLRRYQLTLEELDEKLSHIGENSTGGFLDKDSSEFLIRNIGAVSSLEDIQQTVVGLHFGNPVLLKDIAEIKIDARIKRGDGSFMGKPAVIISIQKQPGSDTVEITRQVDLAIKEITPALPEGVTLNPEIFKQANFIQTSVDGIKKKLKMGTIMIVIILAIFLANFRMTVITLTAIPLSFLVTFIVFKFFGLSINTMTLGGLAIAIGELVDDAIVDVENVFRRLKENSDSASPRPAMLVIYEASSEVRNSIVLATAIIGLVFMPLFALDGLEGKLFTPLAISYLTALFASLVISLTVTPMLCSFFLAKSPLKEHHETKTVIFLKNLDRRVLNWALDRPSIILGSSLVLFFGAVVLIFKMGTDFLPKFNEGSAMVSVIAKPGTSLAESNHLGAMAEDILQQVPEVKFVSRRTGRAELDEHAEGVNVSEIDIDFHDDEKRPRDTVLDDIRERLEKIPGVAIGIGQPISHRLDHLLSGVNAAIAIKIFGPDLNILRNKAHEIKTAIAETSGIVDLQVESQTLIPQLKIFLMREEMATYGISAGELTRSLEMAFNGKAVSQLIEDQRVIDIFVRLDDQSRKDLDAISATPVKTMPDGKKILLGDVADVYETDGPNQINRENAQRRIVISANSSGRDLGGIVADIQKTIAEKIQLPEGYYAIYGGQFESQQSATRKIILYSLISLIGVAIILYASFQSWMIAFQIMLTIPLAFMGGVYSLYFTDRIFSVASLIGLVTLCGISSRNGIMMISHYLHLMKYEGEKFTKEMVIRGSLERLVPVMMTALTAALGILPLVFAHGQPGSEILHPVAIVIVGGLISSTLLDFIVTPTVFYLYGKKASEHYLNQSKEVPWDQNLRSPHA
jgi:Cu(I)/Ag(I) efflux system membrane protein CusA/SilA